MTKRTTLLLLSGGLDSTTCLFKLLTETDDDVHTFYVDVRNNKDKAWCENQALNKIRPIAEGIRKFTHHDGTSFDIEGHTQGGIQPLMWMMASALMFNKIDGPRKRLCVGYTVGDDTVDNLPKLQEHWKYLWSWLGRGRRPPLYLPLAKRTKMQSMDYLRRLEFVESIEIVKHLWTCEMPEFVHDPNVSGYRACKHCTPCKRGLEIGLVQP
jgi:hypothetical protein